METLEVNLPLPPTVDIVIQPKFALDDAITLFVLFCVPAVPRLQVQISILSILKRICNHF